MIEVLFSQQKKKKNKNKNDQKILKVHDYTCVTSRHLANCNLGCRFQILKHSDLE